MAVSLHRKEGCDLGVRAEPLQRGDDQGQDRDHGARVSVKGCAMRDGPKHL